MKKKRLLLLFILVLGLILGGCSDSTENPPPEAQQPEAVPQAYGIGTPIALKDGSSISVNSMERSAGGKYNTLKDGQEYVIVNVSISNAGADEISYNEMFDFKCKNSQGQIKSPTIAFGDESSNTSLGSGNLAAGGNVSGTIAFEQPVGDAGLSLIYESVFSGNKSIEIPLV